jgi:hypothetical protein
MTAEDLTRAIVKAISASGRDAVVAVLKNDFGVSAGREITDPVVRQEAADKLAALSEQDVG